MKYTLVKIDPTTTQANGQAYWQIEDENDRFLGLFDDDGDKVELGNCTWTAIRSDLAPPFVS